jgi:hypothetical protein
MHVRPHLWPEWRNSGGGSVGSGKMKTATVKRRAAVAAIVVVFAAGVHRLLSQPSSASDPVGLRSPTVSPTSPSVQQMSSPSSSKRNAQAMVITLLRFVPLVLAIVYGLAYTYAFQFLTQFGVTPEEVGISEIKILTRAALFTIVVVSVYGILFVLMSLLLVLPNVRFTRVFKRSRGRDALSLVGLIIVSILLTYVLDLHLAISAAVVFLMVGVALAFLGLFLGWKRDWARYTAWTGGIVLIAFLLARGAYAGGAHSGIETARNGSASPLASALGVDVLQVHPKWSDSKLAPPRYSLRQDFLELGSDDETTFLYDCWTATTYRIPLHDVVLSYSLSLNQPTSTTLQRLHCR